MKREISFHFYKTGEISFVAKGIVSCLLGKRCEDGVHMNPQEIGNRLTDNTVSQLKKPLRKSLSLGVQSEIMSMPDCMCE